MQNAFSESGNSPPIFYTYLWLREDGTPYYVGKGKGNRAWRSHKGHRPPKDLSRIHVQYWQDEATAFAYEIYQIDFYGRKDLGTGCLRNLTDGGEGKSGAILSPEIRAKIGASNANPSPETIAKMSAAQCKRSPETLAKMSASHMGHKASPETTAKLMGRKHSPETIAKIRATKTGCKLSPEHRAKLMGRKLSPETLAKISAALRGRKRSPEHQAKLNAANTGNKRSSEARIRMSISQRIRRSNDRSN
jgi:hypothetical protein